MSVRWYYQHRSGVHGPVSSAELKQLCANGVLDLSTPVQRTSDNGEVSEWVAASSVKGLFVGSPLLPAPSHSHSLPEQTPVIASRIQQDVGERFVVSSTVIDEQYKTLGLVVGFSSRTEGCGGSVDVEKTYRQALDRLIESAKSRSANGLIGVSFQNRVASSTSCIGQQQVFEVFAWGTAVTYFEN
ncbi:GYF domain-containing protein [Botrimarina colliarenosi]|uniref:GYF domain-containing protein n=1 Tax=Botrimarina colliarenosi TaxID=2528001 RepID=UPI0036F30F78